MKNLSCEIRDAIIVEVIAIRGCENSNITMWLVADRIFHLSIVFTKALTSENAIDPRKEGSDY